MKEAISLRLWFGGGLKGPPLKLPSARASLALTSILRHDVGALYLRTNKQKCPPLFGNDISITDI